MKNVYKRIFFTVFMVSILFFNFKTAYADTSNFSDVEPGHWAYSYVNKLRELKITSGVGDNRFGLGETLTKAEFVTFLCNIMKWELSDTEKGSFTDNQNTSKWYFKYIETALQNKAVLIKNPSFHPQEAITREEIAVMLVRALGYDLLANQLTNLESPFSDVTQNAGYITIAKDLGIISGMGNGLFMPDATATREQAAAMMILMYEGLNRTTDFKNGVYAISSSSQLDAVNSLDSVCFGWGRLELNGGIPSINTTFSTNNEYYIPSGYEIPYKLASNKTKILMTAVDDKTALDIISNDSLRETAAKLMTGAVDSLITASGEELEFDGILVDFESLKGEAAAQNFNVFLTELRRELDKKGKLMYVAVHPKRRAPHEYFNGYDYKIIGQLADKVILMAHDYNAKQLTPEEMESGIVMTPLAPLDEVYFALREIINKETGIENTDKIMLQISFATAQWKLKDGKVINTKPFTPDYSLLSKRIQSGVEMKYSQNHDSPYITFYNPDDETDNVLWYEDERSVDAKVKLARLFGVTGLSLWRLGLIPNDNVSDHLNVYQSLLHTL